jgi:predicted Co/Zn/Cd cation transporter (cation efflux family)
MAPPEAVVDEIERRLRESLRDVPHDDIELRVSKQGRHTYLLVHIVVPSDFEVPSIEDLDQIRFQTEKSLQDWNPEIVIDMLFVADPELTE